MRKLYLLIVILTFAFSVRGEYQAHYYDRMDGKKKEALKEATKACVQRHTTLDYYELPNYWQYSDVYPERVDGYKRWWEMYSNAMYLIRGGQSGKESFSANKMQREHSVPKSWWKQNGSVEYTPAYSDMWNLYPSDPSANQAKLNYPFGITRTTTFNNGVTKVGEAKVGYGGGSAYVFEPGDEYKGDFARAVFYMATVYDDINWVINYMFVKESYPTLKSWAINMLLDWSRTDKVSQKEIDRNNVVEQYQGNRNPFIDFPELAEYIWGNRSTETFYISDQVGSDPTPPITGDPEISSPVNGETLDFGQAADGGVVNRVLQISGKNLTESLSVRISGSNASMFTPEVRSIPASTMNQNQGYLLGIAYQPQGTGRHEAKIILYDGGLAESIVVTLTGESLPRPDLGSVRALEPTRHSDTSYTANWTEAPGIADYYILTRIRNVEGDLETDTYETGETSYTFGDRNPEVAESYYVNYSRLGLISETSNTIYVAAGSGITDLSTEGRVNIYPVQGGFIVFCDGKCAGMTVTDIHGYELQHISEVHDGERITLDSGIYIISVPGERPFRITVR